MAGAERRVTVSLLANDKGFTPPMRNAVQVTEELAKDLERLEKLKMSAKELTIKADIKDAERDLQKLGSESSEMFKKRADEIGNSLTSFGKKATIGLTLPILAGFKAAGDAASDMNEAVDFSGKLFGTAAEKVHEFGKTAAKSHGESRVEVEKYAQSFAGLLKVGVSSQEELATKSIELTKRAGDLGAALNKSSDDVAQALRSGLAGQTEPLLALNIVLDDAQVKTRAYALGLTKAGQEVSQEAKIQARYSLIMEKSQVAAGNFADTLGTSVAGQAKVAQKEMENAAITTGQKLQPAMMAVYTAAGNVAEAFGNLSGSQQQVILFGGAAIAALGPIVGTAGSVVKGIGSMKSAIDGMRTAEGGLTGMGKAMAGLGMAGAAGVAVAGAFALKGALYAIDTQKVTKEFTDLQAAIAGYGGQSVRTAAAQYAATIQLSKGISDTVKLNPFSNASEKLKDAEQAFAEIQKLIKVDPVNARIMIETLEKLPDPGERARKKIAELRSELEKNEAITKSAAAANDTLSVSIYGAAQSVIKGVKVAQDWKVALQATADAQVAALKTQMDANRSAEQGESVRRGIADAERGRTQQTIDAARNVETAQKNLNLARANAVTLAKEVDRAEKDLKTTQIDLYNATENQKRAEDALNHVFDDQPAKIEDIQRAEENLANAREAARSAERAAKGATEAKQVAEEELADLQANGALRAQKNLDKAKRDSNKAVRDLARAEQDRIDLLNKGGATQAEVADADDRIADAKDRVQESIDRVAEAEKKLAGIGDEINKAREKVKEREEDLTTANEDSAKATKDVETKETELNTARQTRKPSDEEVQKRVEQLRDAMKEVAEKTDAVKGKEKELDDARKNTKEGFEAVKLAEAELKTTTLTNEALRKTAVENVTKAYKAQAAYLLSQDYEKAVAKAAAIANGTGPKSSSAGSSSGGTSSGGGGNGSFGDSYGTSANVRAFLDAIAAAEGTAGKGANGYNVQVGGKLVGTGAAKPRQIVDLGNGLKSSAAGRYQFLNSTWDSLAKQLGLNDFSAESQDKAAIELIRQSGALGLVEQGKFQEAITAVRKVWASLPGAGYGQGERSMQFVLNAINESLRTQGKTGTTTNGRVYGPPAPAGTKGGGSSAGGGGGASYFSNPNDPEDIADEIDDRTGRRITDTGNRTISGQAKQTAILADLKSQGLTDEEAQAELLRLTDEFSGDLDAIADALGLAFSDTNGAFDKAVDKFVIAVESFANKSNGSYAGNVSGPIVIPTAASIFAENSTTTAAMRAAAAARIAGGEGPIATPASTPVVPIALTTTSGRPITVDPLTGERRPSADQVTFSFGDINVNGSGRTNVFEALKGELMARGLVDADGYMKTR